MARKPTPAAPATPALNPAAFVLVDMGYSARFLLPVEDVTPFLTLLRRSHHVRDSDYVGGEYVYNVSGQPTPSVQPIAGREVVMAPTEQYKEYVSAAKADATMKDGTGQPVISFDQWKAAHDAAS